jgi:hypothetical protein
VRNVLAFTLLELLMATVLMSLLMVGVLAVVATLGKAETASGAPASASPALPAEAMDAWVSLLREDLSRAGDVEAQADGLALTGYMAFDGSARECTHRPAEVAYKIEDVDGRRWLVRRQAALDVLTNRNVQRDLVCCGVTRFCLTRLAETGRGQEQAAGGRRAGAGVWRLQVWTDGRDEPACERVVAAFPK